MKKLLFKCLLLLVLVGGLVYGGGAAYRQTNTYRNLDRNDDLEKFHSMPQSVDVAVFGSSHGMTNFKTAPDGAVLFNFALSSQIPVYDLRVMRQYQDHIRPGALVILTVGPSNPYYLQPDSVFSILQPRYYRFLSPENIVDVDISLYLRTRFSPLLTEDVTEIIAAFFADEEPALTVDARSGHRQTSAEDMPDEMARIRRDHISAEITTFPEENPVMMDAYREMLRLCQENGWQAVLVTPPYLAEYCACFTEFSEDFFDICLQTMEQLGTEFGVPYMDYSRDPNYAGRYDLFKNIDHLNLEGAAEFNEQFFEDLRAMGVWQ